MRSDGHPQAVAAPAPPPPPPPPAPPAPGVAPIAGGAPAQDVGAQVGEQVRDQVREQVRQAMTEARDASREAGRLAAEQGRMDAELARARREVATLQRPGGGDGRTVIRSSDGATIVREADGSLRITSREGKTITIQPGMLPGPVRDAIMQEARAQAPVPLPVQLGPPPGVIEAVVIMVAIIVAGIVLYPIARAWAGRVNRRAPALAASPEVVSRLDRLEQAVEAVAIEMERVSEAQRYSARLLTERLPERMPQLGGAEAVTATAPVPDARR